MPGAAQGAGVPTWWQMLCTAIRLPGKTLCECGRLQDGAGHALGAHPLRFLPLGHFAASTQLSLARSRTLCSCPSTSHGSGCREPCLVHRAAAPAAPADLRTVPMGSARAASAPCASPYFFSLRKSSALGLLKSKVGENSTWTIPCTHRCAGPPAAIGASSPQPELAGSHHVVIPSPHTCTPRASAKLCPPLSLQKPLCQRPAETDRDERPLGAAHQLMPGALPPRGTAAASSPGAWLPP